MHLPFPLVNVLLWFHKGVRSAGQLELVGFEFDDCIVSEVALHGHFTHSLLLLIYRVAVLDEEVLLYQICLNCHVLGNPS